MVLLGVLEHPLAVYVALNVCTRGLGQEEDARPLHTTAGREAAS